MTSWCSVIRLAWSWHWLLLRRIRWLIPSLVGCILKELLIGVVLIGTLRSLFTLSVGCVMLDNYIILLQKGIHPCGTIPWILRSLHLMRASYCIFTLWCTTERGLMRRLWFRLIIICYCSSGYTLKRHCTVITIEVCGTRILFQAITLALIKRLMLGKVIVMD